MKTDLGEAPDLSNLLSSLQGLSGQVDGLQNQISQISAQVQALNLDLPRPIDDFAPRIADGASATSLAGTDPNLGGAVGGADKGGAGQGVKETSSQGGKFGYQK